MSALRVSHLDIPAAAVEGPLRARVWISEEAWYNPRQLNLRRQPCRQGHEMTETSAYPEDGGEFDLAREDEDETPTASDWDEDGVPVPASDRMHTLSKGDAGLEPLEDLIARILLQDEQALASLYDRLGGSVYSLALQITRQVGSAEEVLQDVFWQVWRQAPRFDATRGSVAAWVLTIARSRALDAVRTQMRTPQGALSAQEELDDYLPSDASGPQDLLFAAQQGSRLQAALEDLDPLRRQLVSLSFYRGLTQQEIADHTGLPLGTVKSHLRRSLSALRDALGSDVAPFPY